MKINAPEKNKAPQTPSPTQTADLKSQQAPEFSLTSSNDTVQRQESETKAPVSAAEQHLKGLEFYAGVLEGQYHAMLADAEELRSGTPAPGTQEYADAKAELNAAYEQFAGFAGTYYGNTFGKENDSSLSQAQKDRYQSLAKRYLSLIHKVGPESPLTQAMVSLPRADVINFKAGNDLLPRPEKGNTHVAREDQEHKDGVLSKDYLRSQGYVEQPAQEGPGVNVPPEKQTRTWIHPETGARVILSPKK